MVTDNTKIISLKFDGKNLTPVKLGRNLLALLVDCYDLAESRCEGGIAIETVEANCVTIRLRVPSAFRATNLLDSAAPCSDVSKYNKAVRHLNSFLERHSSSLELLNENNAPLGRYGEKAPIPEAVHAEPPVWTQRKNVYGRLLDVGGTTPNIHLQIPGQEKSVVLSISEDNARKIAARLYTNIGVFAEVKTQDGRMAGGKVLSILEYKEIPFKDWLEKVRRLTCGAFEGVDVAEYIKEMRG